MTRRYLAFDIETAKITPQDEDVQAHRPLGIACWAAAWVSEKSGEIITRSYAGTDSQGSITPQMSRFECCDLVRRLRSAIKRDGFTLLTHNGVGFDFDILAEESGMHAECADLALRSMDTCLLIHCMKGFPVGLDAIARGMGLLGKTEGMSGALAPQMWADGRLDEVLGYVAQDVRSTLEVALAIKQRKGLTWISKSGRRNSLPIPRLLTVAEALQLPEPDTSWMSEPMPRTKFVGWMKKRTPVLWTRHALESAKG